jgi:hypothetical protein
LRMRKVHVLRARKRAIWSGNRHRTQINAKSIEMNGLMVWIMISNKFRAFSGREWVLLNKNSI